MAKKNTKRRTRTKSRVKSRSKSKSSKKRVLKKKLAGFTKVKKRFALVFKKGSKLSVGKKTFKSKTQLTKEANKFL